MTENVLNTALPADFNRRVFLIYLIIMAALLAAGCGYLLYKGRFTYLGLILASPMLIMILTQPKLAIGQYIFMLFIGRFAFSDGPFLLADFSGFIVIGAALLDFLVSKEALTHLPKLSLNLLSLLFTIFLTGIFSYNPEDAIRPFGRIFLIFCIFLSIYRLSKKFSPASCINLFYLFAILNSFFVLAQFILSRGSVRSFGMAPVIFDELALLALVIAVAKFLWSAPNRQGFHLAGTAAVLLALLSTQSRAPILFGLIMAVTMMILTLRRSRRLLESINLTLPEIKYLIRVKRKPLFLFLGSILMLLILLGLFPDLYAPLLGRFEELLSFRPSTSFLLRIFLWKTAFTTFLVHPILGVGPGVFKELQFYNYELKLSIYYIYVRGLSAHNLLLHYLAESGIVGAAALLALMVNLTRLGGRIWRRAKFPDEIRFGLIIFSLCLVFLMTTVFEAGWMWGQTGLIFAFFAAIISRSGS